MIIRRLMVPLTIAVVAVHAGHARAQAAFPAPLPGQPVQPNSSVFPPVNAAAPPSSSFPVNGAAPVGGPAMLPGPGLSPAPPTQAGAGDKCMKEFVPLREETERRAKLIKAASEHHASPDEACKLFKNYSQSEVKMLKYVESHATKCGIPPQIAEQLKGSHKNTESIQAKVCNAAEQVQARGPAGPSLSEVLGSTSAPEATPAKKGGSTFDTLNGNVLTR